MAIRYFYFQIMYLAPVLLASVFMPSFLVSSKHKKLFVWIFVKIGRVIYWVNDFYFWPSCIWLIDLFWRILAISLQWNLPLELLLTSFLSKAISYSVMCRQSCILLIFHVYSIVKLSITLRFLMLQLHLCDHYHQKHPHHSQVVIGRCVRWMSCSVFISSLQWYNSLIDFLIRWMCKRSLFTYPSYNTMSGVSYK